MASNKLRVAILGASGYTGAELVRLLSRHPQVAIVALTADRQAGKPAAEVFPQLVLQELPTLTKIDDVDWGGVDFVFCCLPHGLTQEVIAKLPRHLKIVDLSADFLLSDIEAYDQQRHGPSLPANPLIRPARVGGRRALANQPDTMISVVGTAGFR